MKSFLLPLLGACGLMAANPPPPIELTARLRTPTDVDLRWTDPAPAPGHCIEFTMNLADPFIPLGYFTREQSSFAHPRLVPRTTFHYRVRAYHGAVSNVVEMVLPERISDAEFVQRYGAPEDFTWAEPHSRPDASAASASLRTALRAAAPVALRAEFVTKTVSGFQLTWSDRAADADGYMLEIKPEGAPDFVVCALMPSRVNAFGWALQPPVRKAQFRVRAFYYGPSSNVVAQTTGDEPPDTHVAVNRP